MTFNGSTILITGGTGSFGSHVANRLLQENPAKILVFSRDEKKQSEMQRLHPEFQYLIGDVRDTNRVQRAMENVDFVFHAAALKQVPSCEQFPFEAVQTNIIGSRNVCEAARAQGVKMFIALSTDKSVKPINAMGMSKALMEKIICNQNRFDTNTVFCCVRYGNVMGSRGSVIPLFKKQIKQDIPLTITVPEMTRFLMTLEDSIELVLQAVGNARGGEIFIRKASACTMGQLAEAMRLRYSPRKQDHPITTVGIRPGEKIHEILVNEYEMQRTTEFVNHFVIYPEYRISEISDVQPLGFEYTSANTEQLETTEAIIAKLEEMTDIENHD